jgi:hypothetical protein
LGGIGLGLFPDRCEERQRSANSNGADRWHPERIQGAVVDPATGPPLLLPFALCLFTFAPSAAADNGGIMYRVLSLLGAAA